MQTDACPMLTNYIGAGPQSHTCPNPVSFCPLPSRVVFFLIFVCCFLPPVSDVFVLCCVVLQGMDLYNRSLSQLTYTSITGAVESFERFALCLCVCVYVVLILLSMCVVLFVELTRFFLCVVGLQVVDAGTSAVQRTRAGTWTT